MFRRFIRFSFDKEALADISLWPLFKVLLLLGVVVGGLLGYGYLDDHGKIDDWFGRESDVRSVSDDGTLLPPVTPTETVAGGQDSPAANAGVSAGIEADSLEQRVHAAVNLVRESHGLSVLGWDAELATISRGHSQDMVDRGYFAHDNPEGDGPVDRCRQAGFSPRRISAGFSCSYHLGCAENLFQGNVAKIQWYVDGEYSYSDYYAPDELAGVAVQGWMDSPAHRENILTGYWKTEGIGIVISAGGEVFITQNFN